MPFYGEVPRSSVDPTEPAPFEEDIGARMLPIGAGVCAFDRDECTVTIALDSEADVEAMVRALPGRRRVRVCG